MKKYWLSVALLIGAVFSPTSTLAQTAAAPVKSTVQKTGHKGGPTQNASVADIANAKAKGLVWVNTGTGVYHKDGEFFGATKEGKFLTEDEAKAGHFRAAKDGKVKTVKTAKAVKPAVAK